MTGVILLCLIAKAWDMLCARLARTLAYAPTTASPPPKIEHRSKPIGGLTIAFRPYANGGGMALSYRRSPC